MSNGIIDKNSKWLEYLLSETEAVQNEILRGQSPTKIFQDFGDIDGITLDQLEELDTKYSLVSD